MSKLVFLDLDDTLLDHEKRVSTENRNAITRALEEGNIVSICSGRSVYGGSLALKELGISHPNLYQIGYHGGLVRNVASEEVIARNPMDIRGVVSLLQAAKARDIFAVAFAEHGIYCPNEGEEFKRYIRITNDSHTLYDDPAEILDKGVDIYKVLLADFENHDRLVDFQNEFKSSEADWKVNSFFSCMEYLEFVKVGVDKGLGLRTLTESLGRDIADTIAVGDERNDISMIEDAGLGCAMANAHPETKAVADYITENDCEHSGVAEVFEKFVL